MKDIHSWSKRLFGMFTMCLFRLLSLMIAATTAMKDNAKQLNTLLQASGLQQKTEQPALSLSAKETATTAGFDSSKLTKIRLEDDHDKVKGAAEVYALVTGVLSQNEPLQVLAVREMPYLDNDKTDYYPNQIVINWSAYDYRVVDMLLYESDNGTTTIKVWYKRS
ncbi:DUF3103 family protein [Vibrio sp. PP-XX7]